MKPLLLLSFVICFGSCGDSEADKALNEKAVQAAIDSTKRASEQETANKIEAEKKEKELEFQSAKAAQQRRVDLKFLTRKFENLQVELLAERDKLLNMSRSKLLKTSSGKADQIRRQGNKINEIAKEIDNTRELIRIINTGAKYTLPPDEQLIARDTTMVVTDTTVRSLK